ncbi:MAG: MerR family transcriptional regulator [Dehalococcoidia bacterium]
MTIGEAAKSIGAAVSTVRYYDELGMLPAVARIGGKRHFDQESLQRLTFIQHCKSVGLSLEDIRTILNDKSGGWHDLVARKIVEMTETRNSFTKMISQLEAIKDCGCMDPISCASAGRS